MTRLFDPEYKQARAQFAEETRHHKMTILHDDGVYRHLRFAAPGTSMWSWSIITWPGHLATSGDVANGYQFSRLPDMFEFFRTGGPNYINPGYWAEKMPHTIKAKTYSEDLFKHTINDYVSEWREEMLPAERASFTAALEREVYEESSHEETAREALEEFSFTAPSSGHEYRFTDIWEWDFTDYDHHLILAMLAISWGIAQYDAAKAIDGSA